MKTILYILTLIFSVSAHSSPADDAREAASRGDYKTAIELLTPLAESGDVDALGNLGNIYGFGRGVERDLVKAEKYWRRAAEKGLGTAMGNIGSLYQIGQGGLPKDSALAAQWYLKAAEHRHTPSMLTLSSMYMNGVGVPFNAIHALAWSGLAAMNATDPRIKQMAGEQTRKIASELSREQIVAADTLSREFAAKIDVNVARYKAQ